MSDEKEEVVIQDDEPGPSERRGMKRRGSECLNVETAPQEQETGDSAAPEEAVDESEAGTLEANSGCDEAEDDGDPAAELLASIHREVYSHFLYLTGANEAEADLVIEANNWHLYDALRAFIRQLRERNQGYVLPCPKSAGTWNSRGDIFFVDQSYGTEQETDDILKVISWNIDGLGARNIEIRTEKICSIIRSLKADVVFLQEVIDENLGILKEHLCQDYRIIPARFEQYFTVMILDRRRITLIEDRVLEFESTAMGRNLHMAEVRFKEQHKLFLLTTHLESVKDYGAQRQEQLWISFEKIAEIPDDYSVIFAGDLSLRDSELEAIGGIPNGLVDVWQEQGSDPVDEFTWDLTANDNLPWDHRFTPKLRYDRMYFRESTSQPTVLKTKRFKLIGKNRIMLRKCFPSDHWGLFAQFEMFPNESSSSDSLEA